MSSPSLAPTMAASPMASVWARLSTSASETGSHLDWKLLRDTDGSADCLFWPMTSCYVLKDLQFMVHPLFCLALHCIFLLLPCNSRFVPFALPCNTFLPAFCTLPCLALLSQASISFMVTTELQAYSGSLQCCVRVRISHYSLVIMISKR